MSYEFRRIRPSDLPSQIELYRSSFGEARSLQALTDKFRTEFTGVEYIGYLAITQSEQLAAFYGLYPVEMIINGSRVLGAQSGDTMTHPEHQKKSLFTQLAKLTYQLAKLTYQLAREQNIELIYGFPNDQSYPGFKKHLGWSFPAPMNTARIENNQGIFKLQFRRLVNSKEKLQRQVCEKLRAIEIGSNKLDFTPRESCIIRDSNYLDYKHRNSAGFTVAFENLLIWLSPGTRIKIDDFIEQQSLTAHEIDASLQRLMQYSGARSARFEYSDASASFQKMRSVYDFDRGNRVGFLALNPELSTDSISLCQGDFDFF